MPLQADGVAGQWRAGLREVISVSVDVAERIYQRYLESFSHSIAEKSDSTLKE